MDGYRLYVKLSRFYNW